MKDFLESKEDGVFYIGHASALVRLNGRLLLLDPVWNHKPYGDYWDFNPRQIDCSSLPPEKVEFCVVSHIHEDHVCDHILRTLNKSQVRFAIMGGGQGRIKLEERLKSIGVSPRTFEPFQWHKWIGLEFYFVPHAFNTVDSSCFIRNPNTGYTVYHGNDNFLSHELIERIRPDIQRVDVAMVPYAFVHWYPMCMGNMNLLEKRAEVDRLNRQSLMQAYTFVDAFNPVHTIPFGNSLVHLVKQSLNDSLAKPEDFSGCLKDMVAGGYILGHTAFMPRQRNNKTLQMERLARKVVAAETTVPGHQMIVGEYVIDLEHRTVWRGESATKNLHKFEFAPLEYHKWLEGEITFEQAIGTRQFTCTRIPNVYNLQVFEWMNQWL